MSTLAEKAAALKNGLTGAAKPPAAPSPTVAKVRPSVEQVVRAWADTIRPENAPRLPNKGPLAWVREERVAELLKALAEAGYR